MMKKGRKMSGEIKRKNNRTGLYSYIRYFVYIAYTYYGKSIYIECYDVSTRICL